MGRSRFWGTIAVITAIGGVLRVAMLAGKWAQPLLLNDSLWYSGIAQGIAKGDWFHRFFDVSGAEHAPLTPLLLSPASLFPRPDFWQRATMTVIGIAAIPLMAVTGRRLGGVAVGVVAAALAALYPNIWMSDALVMSETIAMALVTLSILTALRHRARFDVRSAVLAGFVVGLAGLARSELLVLAPLFALVGRSSRGGREWVRGAGLLVGATLLTIVPWVAFNFSRFEEPVFMSTNDGTTLLGANCPLTYGGRSLGGWHIACLDSPRLGEDESQRSARQRREALQFARDHASRLPLVVAARALRTVDLFGLDDQIAGDRGEERREWSAWTGIVCFWLLAPLAVIGWLRRRPPGTGVILAAPAACVAMTSVLYYGSHRLRAPAEPAIVLCASLLIATFPAVRRALDRVRSDEEAPADEVGSSSVMH